MSEFPPRATHVWKKLALVLASALVACVLAEVLIRGWRAVQGRPYSRAAAEDVLKRAISAANQPLPLPADANQGARPQPPDVALALQPYYGYDRSERGAQIASELADQAAAKPGERFTILLVGGSVAEIFGNVGRERLLSELTADPRFANKRLVLLNHACAGHKQPQQLGLVTYLLLLGLAPDAVINLDGFNEVALSNFNALHGVHPLQPSMSHWGYLIGGGQDGREALDILLGLRQAQRDVVSAAEFGLTSGACRSAILGSLVIARLKRAQDDGLQAYKRYVASLSDGAPAPALRGPPSTLSGPALFDSIAASWAHASSDLGALCRAHGVFYLHVLQPTLHDAGSKTATAEELKTGTGPPEWVEGVQQGYGLLRARGQELSASGVTFFDASRVFSDVADTLYYDSCHFGQLGNEFLAQRIAAAFAAGYGAR